MSDALITFSYRGIVGIVTYDAEDELYYIDAQAGLGPIVACADTIAGAKLGFELAVDGALQAGSYQRG